MTPKEIGDLIREALEKKGIKQEPLAEQLGMGQSTMSRIVRGEFKRMPSELPRICAELGIALPDLGGKGIAPAAFLPKRQVLGARDFPVYASAEGGPGEIIRSTDPIDFIPRPAPVEHIREAYGLLVTGTSMEPEFKPGEMALVNPLLPIVGGEVYIFYAEIDGEARATIKELRRSTASDWLVSQHNPPPRRAKEFSLPRKEWRWAHRVFGKHGRQ